MSNSLQDQLLKAGLVDEKSVKKVAKEKRKQRRQAKGGAAHAQSPASGRKQDEDNVRRDQALNRQRMEAGKARELDAQVRQLIESNRVPLENGEVSYNFVDGEKIKRLYLSESLHSRITRGRVGIVRSGETYELVSAEAATKIEMRAKERVLVLNKVVGKTGEEEEPYAEFQVPDDLIW